MKRTLFDTTMKGGMALLVCLALGTVLSAADIGSSQFRVRGNVLSAAGGRTAGSQVGVEQILGQAEPLGVSRGSGSVLFHGWRIPPVVALLYRYALQGGWNLRGSPGISDRSIGEIFVGPAGAPIKIGNVQYADVDGNIVEADDADPLLANLAFWVFSYWGGESAPFDTPDAPRPGEGPSWLDELDDGWNLFSPPYHVTVPAFAHVAVVWRWNSATSSYELMLPGMIMRPLEGYWLFKTPETP